MVEFIQWWNIFFTEGHIGILLLKALWYIDFSHLITVANLFFPDASFSENFYGLKRILGNGDKLNTHHKNLSLIFIVILPYLKKMVDEKQYIIRLEQAEGLIQKVFLWIFFHHYGNMHVKYI